MSLINVRNFISPLTSTVNIITILFVMLVFGVYRLSSGRIEVAPRAPAVAPSQLDSTRQMYRLPEPAPSASNQDKADLLRDMLRKEPQAPKEDQHRGSGLSDIERELGLSQ